MEDAEKFVMTRTGYCENCASHNRPRVDQYYIVYGSTSKRLEARQARIYQSCVRGYVPHVLTKIKEADGAVVYYSSCSMIGCGYTVVQDPEFPEKQMFPVLRRQKLVASEADWNALINFKDTDYEI